MNRGSLNWSIYRQVDEDAVPETDDYLLEKEGSHTEFPEHRKSFLRHALKISIALNLLLIILGLKEFWSRSLKLDLCQQLYTPAQDVIEYRNQIFDSPSPKIQDGYAGPPTPERNKKWEALHYVGDTRLSKFEATRIHNKTAAAQPNTNEDYPIVLTVFHDLHCLDSIRLQLGYLRDSKWNDTFNPYTIPWPDNFESGLYSPGHAYHCLNSIRQSLQCFSDVTPQVFQYQPEHDLVVSNFNVLHTCRNFDAIHEWALRRRFTGIFDPVGWREEKGVCGPDDC